MQLKIPINEFFYGGKKVPMIDVPWLTLDLLFNDKNVWMNLQNDHPAHIKFDLQN